jgi:hypothetical protein
LVLKIESKISFNNASNLKNAPNGNGFDKINFDRNLVNICLNVNVNDQFKVGDGDGDVNGDGESILWCHCPLEILPIAIP